jgi:predicted CXXCH cytochrome family protein
MEDFKSGVETVIPWINTNVLMKNTFGVVSSEDMCYSCHDGFVVDSRAVWTGKRHTVFKKPTDKVRIDERKFPLSVKGEIYCGTCHSIHSESSDEIVSFKVFLRMDNRNSEMCRACHTGYDAGPSKGFHTTMKEVKGGFPESLFAAGLRPAANRKDVICSSCHRVHGTPREDLVPSVAGLTDFCGVCHKANTGRGPEGARLLAHRMGAEMKDIKPTEELKKAGAKFDDNRLGCLSCHKLHQGKAADILVMDNPDSELCLQCHDKMKVVRETPHNLAKTGKDLKTAKDKTVGDVGTCSFCHGSHGWTRTISGNEALAKEVCSSCHGTDRKVTKIEIKGPYSHSVGKGLEKIAKGVKIDLPLFTDNHTAGDKVYCSTCHDAHVPGKGAIDDRGLVKTKFLRAENKIALCEKCHVNEKLVRGTGHDAAIFEKKYENINKEGVQVSGLCGACHFVHSGPKPIGFAGLPPDRKYPEEIARNAANLYCLSCHEEGRSGEKKLTGRITHPLGGKPKEAEGDLKDKEVVCASCHDPHRWSPTVAAYGLGKNVDGDLTNSFLRADNSKGKLCEVCHKTEYKVFSSRHDVSEKEKKGVCEFCHVTHNAKGKKLWTRDLTKAFLDEKEQSRACLECHRKEAPGEKAIVKLFRHPDNLLLVNLPLLAKYGLPRDDKSLDMEINCVTCHDPHVWSKTAVEGAAGKEISSKTAFLKAEDPANTACVPCHKIETRYKYQFYHKEKARTKDNPYYDPSNLIESLKKFKKKRYEE